MGRTRAVGFSPVDVSASPDRVYVEGDSVCWQRSRQVARDVAGASHARRFVTGALADVLHPSGTADAAADADLSYDAALITAELTANAVRACRQAVSIVLEVHHSSIRISVYDDGPGLPALRSVDPTGVDGRGLRIVDALAVGWGVEPGGAGKSVWATVRLRSHSAEHLDCRRTGAVLTGV
jgi:anti-sigma regulatory factor (Ser/Thr protein kinase)